MIALREYLTMDSNKQASWGFIGGLASNICTVILTFIAVWALFFSTKHEELLELYQADIRLAKTELTQLKEQKIKTQVQNSELQNKLSVLNKQLTKLKLVKSNLKSDLEKERKVTSETKIELNDNRDLERTKTHLVFKRLLDRRIHRYKVRAKLLTLLPKYNDWLLEEPKLPKYTGPRFGKKGFKKEHKKYEEVLNVSYLKYDQWATKNPLRESIPREEMFDLLDGDTNLDEEWFKRTILKYSSDVKTVKIESIVNTALSEGFNNNSLLVSPKSKKIFKDDVLNYLEKNKTSTKIFLDYSLPTPANDQDIIEAGKRTLEAIKIAQLYINELNDYLEGITNDI